MFQSHPVSHVLSNQLSCEYSFNKDQYFFSLEYNSFEIAINKLHSNVIICLLKGIVNAKI